MDGMIDIPVLKTGLVRAVERVLADVVDDVGGVAVHVVVFVLEDVGFFGAGGDVEAVGEVAVAGGGA